MDYDQAQMAGPPFAVGEAEVQSLLGTRFDIRRLAELDVLAESPNFRSRGLTRLTEHVYALHPRG